MAPVTTESPDLNSVNHGDPSLQCSPATSWAVFIFFASNYLSHCATVRTYPGSSQFDTLIATVLALFLPSYGITRALFSIVRHSRLKRHRNELERAAAAGALRMVVRNNDWKPVEGDRIKPLVAVVDGGSKTLLMRGDTPPKEVGDGTVEVEAISASVIPDVENREGEYSGESTGDAGPASFGLHVERKQQSFHGKAMLPPGYSWANVHPGAKVSWAETPAGVQHTTDGSPGISSNYNWLQALVGLFQMGSAALTLYNSRGDQIQRYGYAAFGLTVVPYLIMSVVNLVAQIASADYPNVYMVSSPEMEEARRHGGVFDGVVGHLEAEDEEDESGDLEYVMKSADGVSVLERVSGSDPHPQSIVLGDRTTSPDLAGRQAAIYMYTPYKLHYYPSSWAGDWRHLLYVILPIFIGGISLIVVGVLTRFRNGDSTQAQRGWIMTWLVAGTVLGWWADASVALFLEMDEEEKDWDSQFPVYNDMGEPIKKRHFWGATGAVCCSAIFCVPAVGGFVAVAGMLWEYGICESS
ncbi:uncharacterized protein B0T15DRAFT_543660 [Chaetomium strumarium]|uniref:Uncharacterized protein n=1 Tax=Chaetomium strumarium TaxID=1170767 RepID=A0AAJ0GMI2_9PEZI|nr:hypothetical protein B0T15DRAFT_543660 [Chaetomium strumarium]